MKRLLSLLLLAGSMIGQTPVTVTGIVQDTTGVLANSGTVTFTLQPQNSGILYFIAGTGVIAPQTGTCGIDALGNIKNLSLTGACQVWGTDLIQPANLTYQIQLFPNGNQGNTISNQCITGSSYSLNSPVFCPFIKPTPQGATVITSPIQNNLIPASNGVFSVGSSSLRYANGFFNNLNVLSNITLPNPLILPGALTVGTTLGVTGVTTATGGVNGPVGNVTPNTGFFTTLNATGTSTLASVTLGAANTLSVNNIKQQAGTSFTLFDPLGVSHFFISSSSPYTNTFISGNGSGSVILGSGGKTAVDDATGNITFSGSTSGTITVKATAIAGSNNLTLPAATDTLVGQNTTDTLTNKTITTLGLTGGISNRNLRFNGSAQVINGNTTDDGTSFTTGSLIVQVKRIKVNQGTALVAGDFSISAGWGTTASVGSVLGTDAAFSAVVTSNGTGQAAGPTVTLTFHDGTWTNSPLCTSSMGPGNSVLAAWLIQSVSATALVLQATLVSGNFTPAAGNTVGLTVSCVGR